MPDAPIKVLLAKKKIDVHGRGSKLIARELRDAGMEVVYFRFGVTEEIVEAAVQEVFLPGQPGSVVAEYIRANVGTATLA